MTGPSDGGPRRPPRRPAAGPAVPARGGSAASPPPAGADESIWTTPPTAPAASQPRPVARPVADPSAPVPSPPSPRPVAQATAGGAGAAPPPTPRRPRRRPEEDDEFVELPPEARFPRWVVALGIVAVLAVGSVLAARSWYANQLDPPGEPGEVVQVEIPQGASVSKVADLLEAEGIITNATIFRFWVGGKDLDSVQAGTYELQRSSSFDEAVEALNAGPAQPIGVETTRVSIPEGLTVRETLARIAEQVPRFPLAELQAAIDQGQVPTTLRPEGNPSYEGLLFPATYEITDDDTPLTLLTQMAAEMERRTAALGVDAAIERARATGLELSPYDLLIIASLVQEESGNPGESPKIATVIENRLREGWALGIDATSRYLAELEGRPVDFESTSPYNTRTQPGLPPTPIASPGEEALAAAFTPAEGPWLYYVLTEPGVHTFTVTNEDFLAAKQICIERDLGCG